MNKIFTLFACVFSIVIHSATIAQTAPPPVCDITPGYTWKLDSLNHYKVYFTNTSFASTTKLTARWFYGDGGFDSTWSPTHIFANAGTYYVCLRVQADSNCYKYQCDSITIGAPPLPVCNITPGYTWKLDSLNHYKVYFTNTSFASTTKLNARWFYGDGGFDSTWSPTHIFANAGTYYVCLRVQADSNCYKYQCDSITIGAPPPPPPVCNITPGYTWKLDSLNHYKVYFTNTSFASTTKLSARWFYGDGGFDSTWSPTHTFANAGTYYVCLRVQADSNCYKYQCDSITIGAFPPQPPPVCNITPGYTWKLDSLNHYKVYFTNTSFASTTKLTARWFYGDGGFDSTWSPTHIFANAGTYYVCLRVQADSNCYKYQCDSITIGAFPPPPPPVCNITPGYTWKLDSLNHYKVYFTNTSFASTTKLTARWFYGDGGFDSTWSPTHTFANAGTYYVCLRVQADSNCYKYQCDSITIGAPPPPPPVCNITPGYTWKLDSLNHYKVYFTNTSFASTTKLSARWFYGDGGFDSTWNTTHTFANTGTYYVCLRVQADSNCYKYQCDSITVDAPVTNTSHCELYAYPNPAHSQVTVNIQLNLGELINICVYDSQNMNLIKLSQLGNTGSNVVTINTERLAAGYYIIKLVYGNHTCTAKFLKS